MDAGIGYIMTTLENLSQPFGECERMLLQSICQTKSN